MKIKAASCFESELSVNKKRQSHLAQKPSLRVSHEQYCRGSKLGAENTTPQMMSSFQDHKAAKATDLSKEPTVEAPQTS